MDCTQLVAPWSVLVYLNVSALLLADIIFFYFRSIVTVSCVIIKTTDNCFRYVHSMNRAGLTYTLKLNHLADLDAGELRVMRGRRPSSGYNGGRAFNSSLYSNMDVPTELNWWLHGQFSCT